MHAKPLEQGLDIDRQIAAQAQEAARAHRQARDERGPVLAGQIRAGQCGGGDLGLLIGQMHRQIGAPETPAGLADHARPCGRRDLLGQRIEP